MKYCCKCKALVSDETDSCSFCGEGVCELNGSDAVVIATVKGRAVALVESALNEQGIPCSFENTDGSIYNTYNQKVNAESDFKLLVPFDFYSRAFNQCLTMGLVEESGRLVPDNGDEAQDSKSYNEKFEENTGVKHRTWQLVWVIIFIVVACLLIWGIDFIAEYIKGRLIYSNFDVESTTQAVTQAVSSLIRF
ncbi:MAG: hypothetical protein ACI4GZ_06690 [Ruminococcus sp.]